MLCKTNNSSFLKSTLVHVRVLMCIYVYMYGSSVLNVWLISEYTFILASLRSTLGYVHVFTWAGVLTWELPLQDGNLCGKS